MGLLQFFVPADDDKTGEDRDAISFAETRAVDSPQATDPEFSLRGTLATGPGARAAGPRRPDPRLELGTRDTITPALDDTITPERLAGASAPRWGEAPGELGTRDTLASDAHMRLRPLDLAAARTSRRPTGDDAELGSRDTLPSDAHMQVLDGRADTVDSRAPLRRVGQEVPQDLEYRRKRAELRAKILGDPIQRFTIGRFQVLGRLGEGGMGVVYAAYDETLDRKVAIKVLRGHASEAAQTRLLREAQALARLTHPNIVAIHEVGEHQGQTFLAMEFVRGESLDAWLETPRPWREVLDVFNQAGRGLEAAHRAGLIHRDFKPHNAILGQDGRVKVLDFGLARASGEALAEADHDAPGPGGALSVSLTHTGAILGTPAYMAPEQHQGRAADARSDQFGFCAALYEALYRQLPFDGATLPALINNILDGALRPPPRDVSVPPWIRKIVTRGLQVDPAARFSSMTELLAALERDPAKRRRRVALTAGALAVMTGGSVALARLQTPEVQAPCAEIPKLFETTWSDTRREATARVFTESALGFAANSWSVIEPALDRYAARWTDARAGSCEAHAQGLVSDTLYDRASACFERRRARVDALLTAFADADASVIENAAIAVAQLPTVDACDDEQRLLAELPPPEDPAAAARVSAARETLARARSLIDLGRYDDATARADEVAAIADEIGYAPLKAEAALTRGTALLWSFTGVGEEAEAALSEAATLAMKSGHDDAAAEAVARRVYVQAEMLAQPAQAQADAWLVDALVARVGDPPALAWLAANNLGVVAERDGDLESATARHARALELVQEDDALRYQRAITLRNIGLVAQGRRDNLEAAEKLARAVTVAEDVLGSEHPQVAIFLTSAGLTLFELDRPSAAEPYLQRALKI
ncbi:MAG: serine/threonine protein kinase, partial [Myxococcales bacterium]|nr:serine/threonine protein kinase [Myxococcales bacterium]